MCRHAGMFLALVTSALTAGAGHGWHRRLLLSYIAGQHQGVRLASYAAGIAEEGVEKTEIRGETGQSKDDLFEVKGG